MMRLCFGTFAQVLRLCKLENVTDKQLVGTMTRTIDPNCKYMEKGNDTAVSRLLSCEGNLSSGRTRGGSGAYKNSGDSLSNVVQLAWTTTTEDVTLKFKDTVLPMIDEDRKVLAVLALLDIIQQDSKLDEERKMSFEKYLGTTKNALLSQGEFVLADFLARVFLYTVVSVKNTVGKDCVRELDRNYISSFESKRNGIRFADRLTFSKPVHRDDDLPLDDAVHFDDDFDGQVIKLDRALRKLNDSVNNGDKNQSNIVVSRFVDTLGNTVSQGKLIRNPAGNLKEFVDNLTSLTAEWKGAEVDEDESGRQLGEIFSDIKNAVHSYLDFRQEYLLARKIPISPNATPSEKMLAIFKQAVLDYRIIDFANNDPNISLSSDLEMDVEYFVAVVKDKVILPFAHNQKDKIFIKINEFIQMIESYNCYLSNNMRPISDSRLDTFVPLHRDDNIKFVWEFEEATVKFRKQLESVYGELCDGETLFIYSINDDEYANNSTRPFIRYLVNVKEKYSMIKTLLYSDQPRPFYDFYVCNDIERRIPVSGRFGTSYRTSIIGNVTAKSLSDCSRFVILSGTGGLGKSMMMRHLLLDSIEHFGETGVIPFFIPLKDFDESSSGLFEYVYSKLESLGGGISKNQFEDILTKGLCILLFDGLDEIGTYHGKRFELDLEEFTDKYPDNCFVISSRPYQSFISYSRFTVLQLKPFSKLQAVKLVENLEFRQDEPAIKEKFRSELEQNLYWSHREFTENPLLLTIMLMTFEQFAEVPSKMHIFYREAFLALSQKHDASKGAYKRTFRTSLSADKFADYFAELCSRSYHDEKFELSETEFANYYRALKEREKAHDNSTTAEEFLYDLCSNMCLMYFESGKYHFTHRSFQEYFCALYFSKQKDKYLKSIGDFFENRRSRTFGDKTFNMLYDMIPEKIEEYIFAPFLSNLINKCDEGDNYWTFLEIMYPCISYEKGEVMEFFSNVPESYIYGFIRREKNLSCGDIDSNVLPHYDSLVKSEYVYVEDEDGSNKLVNLDDIGYDYKNEYGTPETVGWFLKFDIDEIRKKPSVYKELLEVLDSDDFPLKGEYQEARQYYQSLVDNQTPKGDGLFDLF